MKNQMSIFKQLYLSDYLESDGQILHVYNLDIPIDSFAHWSPGLRVLQLLFLDRGPNFPSYR